MSKLLTALLASGGIAFATIAGAQDDQAGPRGGRRQGRSRVQGRQGALRRAVRQQEGHLRRPKRR